MSPFIDLCYKMQEISERSVYGISNIDGHVHVTAIVACSVYGSFSSKGSSLLHSVGMNRFSNIENALLIVSIR